MARNKRTETEDRHERLRAIGELTAGFAHDVTGPLSYMSINLQFVLRELRQRGLQPGDDVFDAVADSLSGTASILALTDGVLRFSAPTRPQRTTVRLNEAIELAMRLARLKLDRLNVKVTQTLGPDISVCGHRTQLAHVVLNLLTNAAEATSGGTRTQRSAAVILSTDATQNYARVRICDNGPGIAPAARDSIFESGFSTKTEGEHGFGLAFCRSIVQAHGGSLTLADSPLGGAAFEMLLPRAAR